MTSPTTLAELQRLQALAEHERTWSKHGRSPEHRDADTALDRALADLDTCIEMLGDALTIFDAPGAPDHLAEAQRLLRDIAGWILTGKSETATAELERYWRDWRGYRGSPIPDAPGVPIKDWGR